MTTYTVIAKDNGLNYVHAAGCADIKRNANNPSTVNVFNVEADNAEAAGIQSWSDFTDEGSMTTEEAYASTYVVNCAEDAKVLAEAKRQSQVDRAAVARAARTALVKEAKFFVASYGAYMVLEFGQEMLKDDQGYQAKDEAGKEALYAEVLKQANRVIAFLEL